MLAPYIDEDGNIQYPPDDNWNPGGPGPYPDDDQLPTGEEDPAPGTPGPTPGPGPGPGPAPVPTGGGSGGGGTSSGGGGGGLIPGSLLEGWGRTYQPAPGLGKYTLPDLPEFKAAPRPDLGEFAPTTGEDVLADPSYDFRLKQGWKPIEGSKASIGMLRSGPTLKALTEYGQSFGSQEFGNVDARRRADFTTNRDTKLQGWDRDEAALEAEFAPKMTGYSTEAASRQRSAELDAERAWQQYLQEWVSWDRDRNFQFNSLANMRDYDLRAATS